jgi:pimeloyl-ACP methyl ester carboxylesterase
MPNKKKLRSHPMPDTPKIDFAILDRPEILLYLFHPRPEPQAWRSQPPKAEIPFFGPHDILIPVEPDVVIGARFHMAEKSACNILFFHGNGEIVADYNDLGQVYNQLGINFLPVDYRGYGKSTGKPTITAMMLDCHTILEFVLAWLKKNNFPGPLILMGRSLGSASVLELAATNQNKVCGLIVESGFAYTGPLLKLLGIDLKTIDFTEKKGFLNIEKIRNIDTPTLIIHATQDHIIPFSDGQALYEASPSKAKTLLEIPQANHNDILQRGLTEYMGAVKKITEMVQKTKI